MYIVGYFLMAAAKVMDVVLLFFMWIVIARAVLSWVNPDPYNAIVRFIHNVTEPVLYPIRSKTADSLRGNRFFPHYRFSRGYLPANLRREQPDANGCFAHLTFFKNRNAAMKLTPLDIQQQQFKVRFRGFDVREVDRFLEQTADAF
jgi:YggT family protein